MAYRLLDPGSEGRPRRQWFDDTAMAELLGEDLYLVGTPKGRLSRLEQAFLERPWEDVRQSVQVKLLEHDGELYVLAQSADRLNKEPAAPP